VRTESPKGGRCIRGGEEGLVECAVFWILFVKYEVRGVLLSIAVFFVCFPFRVGTLRSSCSNLCIACAL
jgi:hypothetical protein